MTPKPNDALSMILLNDFKAQWLASGEHVLRAVDVVGKSGWLVLGNEVAEFERELGLHFRQPHTIGCGNGLDAIEISLRCLDLKPGERVLTTPLSAFATTLGILRAGGVPEFVDVDDSGLIDLNLASEFFRSNPDVKFMVPVHLYGHSLNLDQLANLRDRFNLKIVEDCAQAIGARSAEMPIGKVGQMSATSFYPTKNLGCMGDGGAIFTSDSNLATMAKCLRDYGQSQKYVHSHLGMNSRLDELQAAILRYAFLPSLKSATDKRCEIADRYLNEIQNPLLNLPRIPDDSCSVWHLFPLLVSEDRADFQKHLASLNIQSAIHYPMTIPSQPVMSNRNFPTFPCAEKFAANEVSLPIHPLLTSQELDRVIAACNSWCPK